MDLSDTYALLGRVLQAYGLGEPTAISSLPIGTMNRNWRVTASRRSYAVKQLLDPKAVSPQQHAVVNALADKGFPVPRPIPTPAGETVLELDGMRFMLTRWVEGTHRFGPDLSPAECTEVGGLLGKLQLALADLTPDVLPAADAYIIMQAPDPARTFERIETYLAQIDALAEPDDFDAYVRQRLPERRDLLVRHLDWRPPDRPTGPFGWTHGDFHHNNTLWCGGSVAAVLDWDRLGVWPLANELVRSASFTFGCKGGLTPDLARIAAYARGYRSVVSLTDAEIADAADRGLWSNLTGLWPLDARYERGDRAADFLFPEQCDRLAWWCTHREKFTTALLGAA